MKVRMPNRTILALTILIFSQFQSTHAADQNVSEPQRTRMQKFLDNYTYGMQKFHINKALTGVYFFSSAMAIARAFGYNPGWVAIFTATDAVGTLQGLGMQRLQKVINASNFDQRPDPENGRSPAPQERVGVAKNLTRCERVQHAAGQACKKFYDNIGNIFAVVSATSACYGLAKVSTPINSPAGVQWAQGIYGLAGASVSLANDSKELLKQRLKAERDRRHTAGEGLELQSVGKAQKAVLGNPQV